MNEPHHVSLSRFLAEEAEQAIPTDMDLWPTLAQRLRAREHSEANQLVVGGAGGYPHALQRNPSPPGARWRRPGERTGNLVSFGWGALVIFIIAIAIGLPGRGNEPVQSGAGTPAPSVPSMTPGARKPSSPLVVDCTFDLDVSPESIEDHVVITIRATSTGGCEDASALTVAIVGTVSEGTSVAGSPLSLPLRAHGEERRTASALEWRNWCAGSDRMKLEIRFGSERHTLPLPEAPRCVDRQGPSTLRAIAWDSASPASATPIP